MDLSDSLLDERPLSRAEKDSRAMPLVNQVVFKSHLMYLPE